MKIRVVCSGKPYIDFDDVKSFDLLDNYLWLTYPDGTDTFVNRDAIDFFHVTEDDETA